jgi:uncharacterized protein
MNRIVFSLQQAFKQRAGLKKIKTIKTICDIDVAELKEQGIKVLALDYDGVLTAHNGLQLSSDVDAWLRKALAVFGDKVFVLSNQPKPERMAYFKEQYPSITFVVAKKKPYPDGLQKIVGLVDPRFRGDDDGERGGDESGSGDDENSCKGDVSESQGEGGVKISICAEEVVLVDDRLLTGGLACVLAGCQCLLVTKPYQDFKNHFFYEVAFASLRIAERLLFFKF